MLRVLSPPGAYRFTSFLLRVKKPTTILERDEGGNCLSHAMSPQPRHCTLGSGNKKCRLARLDGERGDSIRCGTPVRS
jgi:hypothetical protein